MTPTNILSALQGRYEWGKRDCVLTAIRLMTDLCPFPFPPDIGEYWHGRSYDVAMHAALRDYGSLRNAYTSFMNPLPHLERIDPYCHQEKPGAIWIVEGGNVGGKYALPDGYQCIAFFDNSLTCLAWAPTGLAPISKIGTVTDAYNLVTKDS